MSAIFLTEVSDLQQPLDEIVVMSVTDTVYIDLHKIEHLLLLVSNVRHKTIY